MTTPGNYLDINRSLWNKRTEVHLHSGFYDLPAFLDGAGSLNSIELDLLGDVAGRSVLHLQCHFGQDTISLARLGATATGADLSDRAIEAARDLAKQTGADAAFVCCDLYDLPQHLAGTFDMVFTSYGTIGWLPDLDRWAAVVAHFLKPGGRFVLVDFHPFLWMYNGDFSAIAYRYFNSGPIIETESGTYADREAALEQPSVGWNHATGEVLNSLLGAGLAIRSFDEYDYSPYNCFRNMVEAGPKRFRIAHLQDKIPMVYALVAIKPEADNA